MVLVKVLQRKDAASLVVAISAGLSVFNFVSNVTGPLAAKLAGIEVVSAENSFANDYWHPFVSLVLQLLALEVMTRLVVAVRSQMGK